MFLYQGTRQTLNYYYVLCLTFQIPPGLQLREQQLLYYVLMSSSSHIRRVEISGEPLSFRRTFDVYLLFS